MWTAKSTRTAWKFLVVGEAHDSRQLRCVAPWHLFRYLDEEAWRYNARGSKEEGDKQDGLRFMDVVKRIVGKRLTYKELTDKLQTA
jgi:hypothetical protein